MNDAFKAILEKDIANAFLNENEFAGPHTINDIENVPCIIGSPITQGRSSSTQKFDGTSKSKITLSVHERYLPSKPEYQQVFTIDGARYRVIEASLEYGLYNITLEAFR